jgi:hypothetical protein
MEVYKTSLYSAGSALDFPKRVVEPVFGKLQPSATQQPLFSTDMSIR